MAKRGRKPKLTKELAEILDHLTRYLLQLERRLEAQETKTRRRRRRRRKGPKGARQGRPPKASADSKGKRRPGRPKKAAAPSSGA